MIPRSIIGQPSSSAAVGSDGWHQRQKRLALCREQLRRMAAQLEQSRELHEAMAASISAAAKAGVKAATEFSAAMDRISKIVERDR